MKHAFMVQSEQVRGERRAYWVICLPCRDDCRVLNELETDNNFVGPRAAERAKALLKFMEETTSQTEKLGVVNGGEEAKVHAVQTSYADNGLMTWCSFQKIQRLVKLDPSESDRLCQRCFKTRKLPWKETT